MGRHPAPRTGGSTAGPRNGPAGEKATAEPSGLTRTDPDPDESEGP